MTSCDVGVPPANERKPNPTSGWRGIYLVFDVSSLLGSFKLKPGISLFYRLQDTGPEIIVAQYTDKHIT